MPQVLVSHVLFFVTEPGLPKEALALGFAAHLAYGWLLLEDNSVLLELDATDLSVDDDEQDADGLKDFAPHILIFSSGDSTPFELRLHHREQDQTVILTGDLTGKVEVMTESEKADALLR